MNTRSAVRQALRLITHHIGLGGDAHPDVTNLKSGFMSSTTFNEHNTLFHLANQLQNPSGTDIMQLPVGYYSGSNLINHPRPGKNGINTAHSYVDIIPSSQSSRRLIMLTEAANNRMYIRSINDSWDVQSPWGRVVQSVPLWEGKSKMQEPVTLANNVLVNGQADYVTIIVTGVSDNNNLILCEVSPLSMNSLNTFNSPDDKNTRVITFFESILEFPSANTAQITGGTVTKIGPTSETDNTVRINDYTTDGGGIYVTGIYGIR